MTMLPDLRVTDRQHIKGGEFNSIVVEAAAGGTIIEGARVALTPTERTTSASSAVRILAPDVVLSGLQIECGPAITGVPETWDPDVKRPNAEVIGWPTARCITVYRAPGVLIEGCELTRAFRGIVVDGAPDCSIVQSNIHHVRTSPIVGSSCPRLRIEANRLASSQPWGWGHALGDHGDFIHIWTTAGGQPIDGVRFLRNLLDEGDGVPILGIYLDDNGNGVGFTDALIEKNTILNGNGQGVALEHVEGRILDNVMLQTSGSYKASPRLIDRTTKRTSDGAPLLNRIVATGNTMADPLNTMPAKYPDNDYIPATGPRPAGEIEAARAAALALIAPSPPPPPPTAPPADEATALRVRVAELEAQLSAARGTAAGIEAAMLEALADLAADREAMTAALNLAAANRTSRKVGWVDQLVAILKAALASNPAGV